MDKKPKGVEQKVDNARIYRQFGFGIENNHYFAYSKEGEPIKWSNFILTPLFHIKDAINPKRLFRLTNEYGHEDLVEFKESDLVSVNQFEEKAGGKGNFLWFAKKEQLSRVKEYLYNATESAFEIKQLGWDRRGFFSFGNGIVKDGQWHPVDDMGIVRDIDGNNYYLPAFSKLYQDDYLLNQFEKKFAHFNYSTISLGDYVTQLVELFGDNAKVGVCFYMATLFKDIVMRTVDNFPMLNLFGPKGSGKSTFAEFLMAFFSRDYKPTSISSGTDASIADAVAKCANALVLLEEYKNDISYQRQNFIKGIYDGYGRSRMNMDRDKKQEISAVDSGVIVAGQEMPTIDIALYSRMVALTFGKTKFTDEQSRKVDELKPFIQNGVTHITVEMLKFRPIIEANFKKSYKEATSDLERYVSRDKIETRTFNNWIIILAIHKAIGSLIETGINYIDLIRVCAEKVAAQNSECETNNEIGKFWGSIDFMHQDGKMFFGGDYKIQYGVGDFKVDGIAEAIKFRGGGNILLLNLTRVFATYRREGKARGDAVLSDNALKYYLKQSPEYIGEKHAVRFKNLSNAQEAFQPGMVQPREAARTTFVSKAMCFDYDRLKINYGIDLEPHTGEGEEPLPF